MTQWILYGVLINTLGNTNNIHIPEPALFKTELACYKHKEAVENKLRNKFKTIVLICKDVK